MITAVDTNVLLDVFTQDVSFCASSARALRKALQEGEVIFDDDGSASTSTIGAWTAVRQDVPEPTSGLLMLLGFAGLALKRKRS